MEGRGSGRRNSCSGQGQQEEREVVVVVQLLCK